MIDCRDLFETYYRHDRYLIKTCKRLVRDLVETWVHDQATSEVRMDCENYHERNLYVTC